MTKKLATINLKGKEYVQVKDRVLYFNETFPNGMIQTTFTGDTASIVFTAQVWPDAKEIGRFFNAHSNGKLDEEKSLEYLETVAVGRALALMGIGVMESVASADEMVKFVPKTPTAPVTTSTVKAKYAANIKCGKCGAACWDNTVNKKYPNAPDYVCTKKCGWSMNQPETDIDNLPPPEDYPFSK